MGSFNNEKTRFFGLLFQVTSVATPPPLPAKDNKEGKDKEAKEKEVKETKTDSKEKKKDEAKPPAADAKREEKTDTASATTKDPAKTPSGPGPEAKDSKEEKEKEKEAKEKEKKEKEVKEKKEEKKDEKEKEKETPRGSLVESKEVGVWRFMGLMQTPVGKFGFIHFDFDATCSSARGSFSYHEAQGPLVAVKDEFVTLGLGRNYRTFYEQGQPVFSSVAGNASLSSMLHDYFCAEVLDKDNWLRCDRCNKRCPAEKHSCVRTAPTHLMLTVKRFMFDARLGTAKILDNVRARTQAHRRARTDKRTHTITRTHSIIRD